MTYEKDLAKDLVNQPLYTAEDEFRDQYLKDYKKYHEARDIEEYEEFCRQLEQDAEDQGDPNDDSSI